MLPFLFNDIAINKEHMISLLWRPLFVFVLQCFCQPFFVVENCLRVAAEPKNHARYQRAITGSFHFLKEQRERMPNPKLNKRCAALTNEKNGVRFIFHWQRTFTQEGSRYGTISCG